MSKVNNIKDYIIPFLCNVLNKKLNNITDLWFKDTFDSIYKLEIYEDGYKISSSVNYPEFLKNKEYNNIVIYLKKVTRTEFVNSKDCLLKFSFNIDYNIYHYIFTNFDNNVIPNNDIHNHSRKRKISSEINLTDLESKRLKRLVNIDWSQMVSASKVINYLLNDTLIDWLEEYYIKSIEGKVKKLNKNDMDDFTKHIIQQGNIFEKEVIKLLGKKVKIVQASESFHAREIKNFEYTKKLMMEGVPVIFQGVLHNYENNTYGCPDLLIRSDYLNIIFNQELLTEEELKNKSINFDKNYFYVVVDIKHSTLHFNVDFKTLRNRDSIPAYKGQLFIYNQALAKIQGYNPMKSFILGKMWSWKNLNGINFMEKLGTIDYLDFDSNYIEQTNNAIKWILRLRKEGHKWEIRPLPSIPELFPNMNNQRDGIWGEIKKDLSETINEITSLWMCGVSNRIIAHNNNIYGYKDDRCCAKLLGFKEGNVSKILDQIIKINKQKNDIVLPKKIKEETIGTKNWRTIYNESLEFYLDFETMNSNLGKIIIEEQNIGYTNDQLIFQIGIGHIKNGKWIYKSFVAPTNDIYGEQKMINSFLLHVNMVKNICKMKKCHFVHWCNAEPISYKKLEQRLIKNGTKIPELDFMDIYSLFKKEPITINGSLNFSLKSIAKAMNKHKLIKTSWDTTNPCSNGLNAMLLAHKAYNDTKEPMENSNIIMSNIVHYNMVDCKVLWEILSFLRNNH